jgi:hypothetical protein
MELAGRASTSPAVSSNLILPAVLLSVIVAAAFIVGRLRVNAFDLQRDGLVLGAIVVMGILAVLVVLAPPAVALVGVPAGLSLAGLYLLSKRDRIQGDPRAPQSMIMFTAVGAVVVGLLAIAIGLVRLFA